MSQILFALAIQPDYPPEEWFSNIARFCLKIGNISEVDGVGYLGGVRVCAESAQHVLAT